jgi:hypothetical protein
MQVSTETLQEVAQYLEQHEESLRIKKLIFCICKKYWENDASILSSISLTDLLGELIQQKPNNDQLTFSIYKLVKTLNRPKVYASVAKVIIEQVGSLYQASSSYDTEVLSPPSAEVLDSPQTQLITPPVAAPVNTPNSLDLVDKAANYFNGHPESARIKKLLFAAAKTRWENSLVAIDSYGVRNLICELKQNHPQKQSLKDTLNRIAENINKKELYLVIAHLIYSQIELLYTEDLGEAESLDNSENDEESPVFNTQIIHINNAFNAPDAQANLETPANDREFHTAIIEFDDQPMMTELKIANAAPITPETNEYDPFEMRMEIFQYTNPLRAKILLFSILFHPWDRSGQDWSTLRSYTIDDLLEQVIQSGKSIKDIESQLYRVSKVQTDVDANLHTASILVQALQRVL